MESSGDSRASAVGFDPARLIRDHQVGIWRYLRVLGCEPNEASDLTQETFLAVLQHPFVEYSPAATAAYLRTVARNLLVSLRRRGGKVEAVADVESLEREWVQWAGQDNGDALLEALRECLKSLTDRARRALEARFARDASRAAIALELNMTEHGAKNVMQRAKQQLRTCIEGKMK